MHYPHSLDICFSKRYHMSVYDVTYETLGHTHPGISTAVDMGEYIPSKKGMEL